MNGSCLLSNLPESNCAKGKLPCCSMGIAVLFAVAVPFLLHSLLVCAIMCVFVSLSMCVCVQVKHELRVAQADLVTMLR